MQCASKMRMFGNRKRRDDDEDSLVPHGLIWQATDEPAPRQKEDPSVGGEQRGQLLEMSQPSNTSTRQVSQSSTQEPLSKPLPLLWPGEHSSPVKAPAPKTTTTQVEVIQIENEEKRQPSETALVIFRWSATRLREAYGLTWRASTLLSGRTRQMLARAWETSNLRERGPAAAEYGKEALERNLQRADALFRNNQSRLAGSALSMRSTLARRTSELASVGRSLRTWARLRAPLITQPWTRIRLKDLPLRINPRFANPFPKWKMRQPVDSRLWNSMGMAAIAALVALAIVSLVPHYASRSLPSRIVRASSVVGANAAAANMQPTKIDKKTTPENNLSLNTSANSRRRTNPKHRRNSDDDYVAPNTYKYYGNRSVASR